MDLFRIIDNSSRNDWRTNFHRVPCRYLIIRQRFVDGLIKVNRMEIRGNRGHSRDCDAALEQQPFFLELLYLCLGLKAASRVSIGNWARVRCQRLSQTYKALNTNSSISPIELSKLRDFAFTEISWTTSRNATVGKLANLLRTIKDDTHEFSRQGTIFLLQNLKKFQAYRVTRNNLSVHWIFHADKILKLLINRF